MKTLKIVLFGIGTLLWILCVLLVFEIIPMKISVCIPMVMVMFALGACAFTAVFIFNRWGTIDEWLLKKYREDLEKDEKKEAKRPQKSTGHAHITTLVVIGSLLYWGFMENSIQAQGSDPPPQVGVTDGGNTHPITLIEGLIIVAVFGVGVTIIIGSTKYCQKHLVDPPTGDPLAPPAGFYFTNNLGQWVFVVTNWYAPAIWCFTNTMPGMTNSLQLTNGVIRAMIPVPKNSAFGTDDLLGDCPEEDDQVFTLSYTADQTGVRGVTLNVRPAGLLPSQAQVAQTMNDWWGGAWDPRAPTPTNRLFGSSSNEVGFDPTTRKISLIESNRTTTTTVVEVSEDLQQWKTLLVVETSKPRVQLSNFRVPKKDQLYFRVK